MTPLQRYLFDTTGYVHIKNALDAEELKRAQDAAHRYFNTPPEEMPYERSNFQSVAFDKALETLTMHPATWLIIKEFTGEKPRLLFGSRLRINTHKDEISRLHSLKEPVAGKLGPRPEIYWQGGHTFCYEDKIHCDFFNIFWYLTDVLPGDGGLVVVQGAHKSEFTRSQEISNSLFNDGEFLSDGSLPQGVINVTPRAGDVLIINEELTHGVMKWNPTDRDRVFAILRYSTHHMNSGARAEVELPQAIVGRLSPETRELLEMAPVRHTKEIAKRDNIRLI